ncbi:hypothetical protein GXB81_02645 [Paraburkholderia sp. Ac-20336]|uniref:hypothetical protein n=1 Tax=Paraburkholderia sp. Ac-20336 TaxID=2703886 RepID=UPI00197E0E4C|nr:hypothetical protein [Paraburkholderia sp. Ac-20336]MBN3801957.1 hypothetical protein [Paraburkholderia sp. Ac-20336]
MQTLSTHHAYPDFQGNEAFLAYSQIRSVYLNGAEGIRQSVERQIGQFDDIDNFSENVLETLYDRLSPVLDTCIYRLGTEHAVFEYSKEEVFEHLVSSSTWAEESYDALFGAYLERRAAVAGDRQYRDERKDGRSRWSGGGFGLSGALSGAAKAGALNMASGLLHSAFNAAANALQESEFEEFKQNYVRSDHYRRGVVALVFELAADVHLVEIALAAQANGVHIEVFENREKRDKSEKMIANIEKIGLDGAALQNALVKAIEFYPYNPRPYDVWLQKFGDPDGALQRICDSFSLVNLKLQKQQILRNECSSGAIDSTEKLAAQSEFLGLAGDSSLTEINALLEHKLRSSNVSPAAVPASLPQSPEMPSPQVATSEEAGTVGYAFRAEDAAKSFASDPDKKFYVFPQIPTKKIEKFVAKYRHQLRSEEVIFYFDDTLFGSGDAGVAVSRRGVHVSLQFGEIYDVPWVQIKSADISGLMNKKITLNCIAPNKDVSFVLTQSNKGSEEMCKAIQRVLSMSR